MVKHRKPISQSKHGNNNESSSSSGASESSMASRTFHLLSIWKTGVGVVCFIIAVYVGTLGYLETRVNTPLDEEKVYCLIQFCIFVFINIVYVKN